MKRQLSLGLAIIALATTLASCVSSGLLVSTNTTQVVLSQSNYKIIATGVSGQATAGYLFGASIGVGMYVQAYALIPLQRDRALYKMAMEELWRNFEARHGKAEGRTLALVNLRYDTEAFNAGFYTQPTLTIIADVVEFQK